MPRQPDPSSQRATAEFFAITPARFCRLLQKHGIDYRDREAVARMLRTSTSMTPATRAAVNAVLGGAGDAAKVKAPSAPAGATGGDLAELERAAESPPPKAGSVEEAEAFLVRLQTSLAIAERTSAELRKLGQYEDARRWLALHAQLSRQYPALHRQMQDIMEKQKITITTLEAMRIFTTWLKQLRGQIETMPGAMSAKCNPSDPEHSHQMLTTWVESMFKTLNRAPTVTP